MTEVGDQGVTSIAFYLPQYHPIPENDTWWGEDFTDWHNVSKARPRFANHYQPHIPEAGFYDPRIPEVRAAQAELAQLHGVSAFCYYHYWFNGRRLLEQPVNSLLATSEPNMPFLLAWANENWTRRWDGKESEVLVRQNYSPQDDIRHIRSLLSTFADPRYATLGARPIFLVYRAKLLPDPQRTTDIWRAEVTRSGLPEPFLIRMETARGERGDPRDIGFDAAVDFEPHLYRASRAAKAVLRSAMHRAGLVSEPLPKDTVRSYEQYAQRRSSQGPPNYPRFPGITPGWDNTSRRRRGAVIFDGSSPDAYAAWLHAIVSGPALSNAPAPVVFVNAWNEWAEGAHLEPCVRWGAAYLEAHARVLRQASEHGNLNNR